MTKLCHNCDAAAKGFRWGGRAFRLHRGQWETRLEGGDDGADDILPVPALNFADGVAFSDTTSAMSEREQELARANAIRLGLSIEQTDRLLGKDDEREDHARDSEEEYTDSMNKMRLGLNAADRLIHPLEATLAANMAGKAVARVRQRLVKQEKTQARLRQQERQQQERRKSRYVNNDDDDAPLVVPRCI